MSDYLLERKVTIFKALAHPVRLAIAERLIEGERGVGEIAQWFPCDRTTISKHLAVLRNAGVIADRKEGLNVHYSLVLNCLGRLSACLDGALYDEALESLRRFEEGLGPV